MTKVVGSNIFTCHMFMIVMVYVSINHITYGVCIPAAKCLMSDMISKVCFFPIIHVQYAQTVNVCDSHSVIMILCKDLSDFKSLCWISNVNVTTFSILCNVLSFILHQFYILYVDYINAIRYFVVVSFFFTGTQFGKLEELLTVWKMD